MLQLRLIVVPCRTDSDSGSFVNAMGVACSVYGKAVYARWRKEKNYYHCVYSNSIYINYDAARKMVSANSERSQTITA